MSYIGMDHGTSGVRFCIIPEDICFEIPLGSNKSVVEEISRRVDLEEIELAGIAYSMGDGISKITPAEKVKNRGVLQQTTGEFRGLGTRAYDEIVSKFRAVVIPGLHRRIDCLDERFRALYSHMASAEKVSIGYLAHLESGAENFIVSDIGSNTVTIGVKQGRFFGAIDACLGAIGLEHGPLDLEAIRRIDRGEITANRAFYSAGAKRIYPFKDIEDILNPKNAKAKIALESLIMSVEMEIFSFLAVLKPEVVVLTGRVVENEEVFNRLSSKLQEIAPVVKLNKWSAARGGAEIAKAVAQGKREILGIEVEA